MSHQGVLQCKVTSQKPKQGFVKPVKPKIKLSFLQGLAGMLEILIQTDLPAELSGGRTEAAVVTTMAVVPTFQRQGIGSALSQTARQRAACYNVEIIALFVYRDNDAAIR